MLGFGASYESHWHGGMLEAVMLHLENYLAGLPEHGIHSECATGVRAGLADLSTAAHHDTRASRTGWS